MFDFLKTMIDFCIHIDKYIGLLISNYGVLVYVILFAIVFCETGLVVTPFLPGDSLLFITGAFAAKGSLNIFLVVMIFMLAAISGDITNYTIGRKLGQKIYNNGKGRMVSNIDKTKAFFVKHGGKTIIIARFMPIIRTFTPFVAGTGKMKYSKFILFSVIAGFIWTFLFSFAGFFFGNLPIVEKNFTLIIYLIITISVSPAVFGLIKAKLKKVKIEE